MRAAHKGLRTLLGSVACVQCLKERAKNKEACCLMEGFLLSMTARMSSERFWRVVWKWNNYIIYTERNIYQSNQFRVVCLGNALETSQERQYKCYNPFGQQSIWDSLQPSCSIISNIIIIIIILSDLYLQWGRWHQWLPVKPGQPGASSPWICLE